MPSKSQIKKLDKVIVKKFEETKRYVYITMVYIDRNKRHEHTVTYDKREKELREALWCTCTSCSNWEVKYKKPCIFKLKAIVKLVEHGFIPKEIIDSVYEVTYG